MLDYEIDIDKGSHEPVIKTRLRSKALLSVPQLNKGSAFTNQERHALGLFGKLPKRVETIEEQAARAYFQLQNHGTRLQKYIFLNNLLDRNQVLYFKLLSEHLHELMPVVYTPTVSTAVKTFNKRFRQPRGLYLCYEDMDYMEEVLANRSNPDIQIIVVTDGEGVLGIGDYGISAMDIPIAKLAVYTALGGINPLHTLPIMLDVGTDNEELLGDPMYLGWHSKRIRGKDYDEFVDKFVQLVKKHFPNAFLHWEDLGRNNASRLLKHYRDDLCTFNDDVQGTGVVALAALLSAIAANQSTLANQRIVIFGGGSAGLGIANSIYHAAIQEGLTELEASRLFWIIDRDGLITQTSEGLTEAQSHFARHSDDICGWDKTLLQNVIEHVKPTILIGCSGCPNMFNEAVVTTMAKQVERPIIMPLSNPTKLAEATPHDLLTWTNGKARIATGSPFEDCEFNGKKYVVSQCNNALIFPALGLAVTAVNAKRMPDSVLYAAAKALASHSPISNHASESLLPEISTSKAFVKDMALEIATKIVEEKLCENFSAEQIKARIDALYWEPQYCKIEAV
ncbi:MAG: NAD-dependent malic enzyme [Legionellaceae bacterium]|nr:NAD-dependent malic enzyme [Legionellaceae bacterium]|tara:strand:- start:67 stop:1764 length:1698 start_codon:yes stop_codon:yes gene_type:complete